MKGLSIASLLVSLTLSLAAGASHHHNDSGNKNGSNNDGSNSQVSPPISGNSEACMDHGKTLDVMNDQALSWRQSQSSGFKTRVLISGTVDEVFPDQTGHRHFSVKVGPNPADHIEVIYNESFGAMPVPNSGESVEACGDYIVATESNGGYPPSPDGALVHWVHRSDTDRHDNGFVMLNGTLYGNQAGGSGD